MHVVSDGFHNTAWLEQRNHSSYLRFAQHCGPTITFNQTLFTSHRYI